MSIVLSKVAEPYAEALLDLAKSNDSLKETTNDMNIVSQFLANSSDLKKFLGNPLITRDAKKNVVKDILGEQISGNTLKFLFFSQSIKYILQMLLQSSLFARLMVIPKSIRHWGWLVMGRFLAICSAQILYSIFEIGEKTKYAAVLIEYGIPKIRHTVVKIQLTLVADLCCFSEGAQQFLQLVVSVILAPYKSNKICIIHNYLY